MRWAGHVVYTRKMSNDYNNLFGKYERKDYSEDPDVDGRIVLIWIIKKLGGRL
jgi:hypothetical protein